MRRPVLYSYFENTAEVLMAKYNQSKLQQSPANIGRNRELFCKEFLSKVLPPKLRIGEGEIWDSKNNRSGQLDIIIIREDAPSLNISEANIFLTEGVFGIIDVKSVLSRAKLQSGVEKNFTFQFLDGQLH